MSPKARYFPISDRPLKMVAGLHRFGTDFGQGPRDRRFFQLDGERARYLAEKRLAPRERHVLSGGDAAAARARNAALTWLRARLAREAPEALAEADRDREARDELEAIARAIQEDVAVLAAGPDDRGRAVALDVRFPSGWRPERLAGADFCAIHAPVPGFVTQPDAAASMVRAMVERGPYVRFVWTVSSDDQLDHHPAARTDPGWDAADQLWLRVERQITVPLPDARASVFLIRTYLYSFAELTDAEHARVLAAIDVMPDDVRAYKSLPERAQLEAILTRASRQSGWLAAPERASAISAGQSGERFGSTGQSGERFGSTGQSGERFGSPGRRG